MTKLPTLHFKPHARLLTMLGDQLIKNERVALIEIIKNSYDADASWVKVTFEGFGPGYKILPKSKIIVEDDGLGMTKKILQEHWILQEHQILASRSFRGSQHGFGECLEHLRIRQRPQPRAAGGQHLERVYTLEVAAPQQAQCRLERGFGCAV